MSQPVKPWLRLRRGLEHDYQVLKVREDRWADPRTGREHPRVRVECADWVNVIAVTAEDQLPSGTPADAATAAAITATARELIACNNAGDFPRVFAFYTDALIRGVFAGNPALTERLAADLAKPAAPLPAAERTELLAVRGVRVLADGRVGAVVEDRDPRQTVVFFAILVQVGDRWLIDGQIDVQAAPPPAGTPAA